ncbi:HD-GYP domain-containing protein, partial [Acidithiobacillus thiooxidans]
ECEAIELAAPLHDIGKIGIPDAILLKPGKLSAAEFDIMKTHAQIGQDILAASRSPYTQLGAVIAGGHHEKFDGSGYPRQLQGEEIPLVARIVAIADVFDALASERPYKRA